MPDLWTLHSAADSNGEALGTLAPSRRSSEELVDGNNSLCAQRGPDLEDGCEAYKS